MVKEAKLQFSKAYVLAVFVHQKSEEVNFSKFISSALQYWKQYLFVWVNKTKALSVQKKVAKIGSKYCRKDISVRKSEAEDLQ